MEPVRAARSSAATSSSCRSTTRSSTSSRSTSSRPARPSRRSPGSWSPRRAGGLGVDARRRAQAAARGRGERSAARCHRRRRRPGPSPGVTGTVGHARPGATPGPTPGAGLPTDVAGLIDYANRHFELAQAALRDSDFATLRVGDRPSSRRRCSDSRSSPRAWRHRARGRRPARRREPRGGADGRAARDPRRPRPPGRWRWPRSCSAAASSSSLIPIVVLPTPVGLGNVLAPWITPLALGIDHAGLRRGVRRRRRRRPRLAGHRRLGGRRPRGRGSPDRRPGLVRRPAVVRRHDRQRAHRGPDPGRPDPRLRPADARPGLGVGAGRLDGLPRADQSVGRVGVDRGPHRPLLARRAGRARPGLDGRRDGRGGRGSTDHPRPRRHLGRPASRDPGVPPPARSRPSCASGSRRWP